MNNPYISVVIPVYNGSKYLAECLESVRSQTLRDIEIICVDDGSSDDTLNILNDYARKDERFIVLTQKNLYAGIARNRGLEIAKGDYLSFLDSDDIFEPDMLEQMYTLAVRRDLDVALCLCDAFDSDSRKVYPMRHAYRKDYTEGLDQECFCPRKDLPDKVFTLCCGWAWDKLFRTSFVKDNNLLFQGLRTTNDAYFVFMSMLKADKMGVTNHILVHQRRTADSISRTRWKDPFCFLDALEAMQEEMDRTGVSSEVRKGFEMWMVNFLFWQIRSMYENCVLGRIEPAFHLLSHPSDYYGAELRQKYLSLQAMFKFLPVQSTEAKGREEFVKCYRFLGMTLCKLVRTPTKLAFYFLGVPLFCHTTK